MCNLWLTKGKLKRFVPASGEIGIRTKTVKPGRDNPPTGQRAKEVISSGIAVYGVIMHVRSLDQIALCVGDVAATCRLYERVLGMPRARNGQANWPLHFGATN